MKALIYEIKSSAAVNAEKLRDEENDRFYSVRSSVDLKDARAFGR